MTTGNLVTLVTIWLLKPLLIILVIFIGALLLKKTSAALQHFWLASGVVALLLLLILAPVIPDIEWQVLPALMNGQQHPLFFWHGLSTLLGEPKILFLVAAVYFFCASSLLMYFLLGIWQLRRQTQIATECRDQELINLLKDLRAELDVDRHVRLLISEAVSSPQVWGLLRPVITLPINASHWSADRKLAVLIHELGHVARFDWAMTILVKILCALFWFLPPVWWLAARLDHYAEMACDDFIYRLRDKHVAYAENLLAFATPASTTVISTPALPMAGHAPMFYRIQAILDLRRPHTPVAPEARQYWVLTLGMMLLPLAGLQLIPIQEALKANLLIVQNPERESESVLPKNEMGLGQTALTDSNTLKQLKRQLLVNELPRRRAHEIDNVIVTVKAPALIEASEWLMDDLDVDIPKPSISVEGYMPLQTVIPLYPRAALQQAIEGEVIVRFTIAADGSVIEPQILSAQPRRIFDKAVLSALQSWRYKPQIIDGRPVVLQGVIETFTFQLEFPNADQRRR